MTAEDIKGKLSFSRKQWLIAGALSLVLLVVACPGGDKSAIKGAVKEGLKDPGSAEFGDMVFSENGQRACIQWNAKNGFGGYGEGSTAELEKQQGSWVVIAMEGGANCDPTSFAILDAREAAGNEAEGRILTLIGKGADPVPVSEGANEAEPRQCTDMHDDFVWAMQDVAEYNLRRKIGEYSSEAHGRLKKSSDELKIMEKTILSGHCVP